MTDGRAPARLLPLIYELADDGDLPVPARGEDDGRMTRRLRARHGPVWRTASPNGGERASP